MIELRKLKKKPWNKVLEKMSDKNNYHLQNFEP